MQQTRNPLPQEHQWQGRRVRWTRYGEGPPVVFCHGTPWSSILWRPFADALADRYTVYLWDMPGYGQSDMESGEPVSLDVQGACFADLLDHWGLDSPHAVVHDYGGAVALRAHLLHGARFASLALVDVVALAPWGSAFFRLVGEHAPVFEQLPPHIHESVVRAYVRSAAHRGLTADQEDLLTEPWLGEAGQAAFYAQMAQADQRYTDEIEPRYAEIDLPVQVIWGAEDTWIPLDRGHRLAETIPDAELRVVPQAGHLIHFDAPVALATHLHAWLAGQGERPGERYR